MLQMQKTFCNSLLFFFFGDLERRDLSHKEKLYLRELNVITETQCTLGSERLRSSAGRVLSSSPKHLTKTNNK